MTAGGLYAWRRANSPELRAAPFASLIFAAIRQADTGNMSRLLAAFPELCAEAQARYNAPGALIPGDPGGPCSVCGSPDHIDSFHADPVTGLISGPVPDER